MKSFQIASLAAVLLVLVASGGALASPTGNSNPYYTPGLSSLKFNASIQLDEFRNAVNAGIQLYRGHLNNMISTHEAFIAGKSNIAWWSDLGLVLKGFEANTLEIANNCVATVETAATIGEACTQMSRFFQNAVALTLPTSAVMNMVFAEQPFEDVLDFQNIVLEPYNMESGAFVKGMRMMIWDINNLPHPMPEPGRDFNKLKVLAGRKDLK